MLLLFKKNVRLMTFTNYIWPTTILCAIFDSSFYHFFFLINFVLIISNIYLTFLCLTRSDVFRYFKLSFFWPHIEYFQFCLLYQFGLFIVAIIDYFSDISRFCQLHHLCLLSVTFSKMSVMFDHQQVECWMLATLKYRV